MDKICKIFLLHLHVESGILLAVSPKGLEGSSVEHTDYPRGEGRESPQNLVWVALDESLGTYHTKRRSKEALPSRSFAFFVVSLKVFLSTSSDASEEVFFVSATASMSESGNTVEIAPSFFARERNEGKGKNGGRQVRKAGSGKTVRKPR